jgi:tripartite-type tricarboxylate transporter receptor subunit TctC
MKHRLIRLVPYLVAAVLATGSAHAHAQSEKAISIVVGYSAGGSADFVARVVANALSGKLGGRQVIVENNAGASGMLALQRVINAPPDGGTIYMGGTDTVLVPLVNAKVKHDWSKDLAPLGRMTTVPMIFAVNKTSPYNTLGELVTAMRSKKVEQFNYATPGIGTMQHLYGELISEQAKVNLLHIPYKGGAQIANDLVGNQVDSAMLVVSTAMPFLKDGKIKALSVSDSVRVPQLPNVRRIGEEEGFKGVALPLWQALFVKSGTPAATTAALEKALLEVIEQSDVRTKLQEAGVTPAPMNGRDLAAFVRTQETVYREIVTSKKITLD